MHSEVDNNDAPEHGDDSADDAEEVGHEVHDPLPALLHVEHHLPASKKARAVSLTQ